MEVAATRHRTSRLPRTSVLSGVVPSFLASRFGIRLWKAAGEVSCCAVCHCLLFLVDFGEEFLGTHRAQPMTEIRLGMISDIGFNLIPISLIIADILA